MASVRVPEKVVQAHIVQLIRSLGGRAYVLGTRRRSTDFHGTMQTPVGDGWPDHHREVDEPSRQDGHYFPEERVSHPKPKPNTTPDGGLACAFGEPWCGPHPLCQAETARICGVSIEEVLLPDYSRYAETWQPEPIGQLESV